LQLRHLAGDLADALLRSSSDCAILRARGLFDISIKNDITELARGDITVADALTIELVEADETRPSSSFARRQADRAAA